MTLSLPASDPASDPGAARTRVPGFLSLLWRRKLLLAAVVMLGMIVLTALAAPLVAGFDPNAMRISQRLRPPGLDHLFGTDEFGRDLFARVVHGGRVSLAAGGLTVLIACIGGVALGMLAGFFPRLDGTVAKVIDAMMAFPDILLAIALVAVLGPSLANVVVALGIVYIPRVARVVRASTLVIRELPFVEAARALGVPTHRILRYHVLRNLTSPIIVQATFIFAYAILAEAGLSFLGVGVSPATPTWGTIINGGQQYARQAQWIMLFPGVAIVLSVFSLQIIGDALRDALDPKLRKDV
ncbi:ABC transporter permease [Arenibaculum sp.]|jgi:peptide/nickel transport system permease protein|uniref:ABC transporter permease n=1 Tax=Arenibaculum sp. TaxID=2865862 RepID=UPI002E0EC5C9|nr:ABC transporter permease [Arenibaculum sp.]